MRNGDRIGYTLELMETRVLLTSVATGDAALDAIGSLGTAPALFVENRGQWDDASIRFVHRGAGANVLVTDTGPVFQLLREQALVGPTPDRHGEPTPDFEARTFSASFVGANRVTPVGADRSSTVFNYFVGDASTWRTNVAGFGSIVYPNLYDGIDLHAWGQRSNLKYEFHVAPGADWGQVAVRYEGIEELTIADDGSLLVNVGQGWDPLRDDAPYVYQEIDGRRVEVESSFARVDAFTYRFEIGAYDQNRELIVDPDLSWSSYLGGSMDDRGRGITMDGEGNALVTGWTESSDFGGAGNVRYGAADAIVTKVTGAGTVLWATYLGGSQDDFGLSIAVDGAGHAVVTGETNSTNFAGATNAKHGLLDAFVAKLSPVGTLLWSTYIGGTSHDIGQGLALDAAGHAIVTGWTISSDFEGAGNEYKGGSDAFVAKVDEGGVVLWARFVGGSSGDVATAVALDDAGNPIVTGYTDSFDFVGVNNVYKLNRDAFVAKLGAAAGELSWATYVGGNDLDTANGIAVDAAGNALLTGGTRSTNFHAANNLPIGGDSDAFVAKVSDDGATLWATYLGGTRGDGGFAIVTNTEGVLISGFTRSSNFVGAQNTYHGGDTDAIVAQLRDNGTLAWMRYIGGSGDEGANGAAMSGTYDALVTGQTNSSDLVHATNAYKGGDHDIFIARLTGIVVAPAVATSEFSVATLPQRLVFTFDTDVSASLALDDVVIEQLPGGPSVTPDGLTYDTSTNTATVTFAGVLADSNYRATLLAAGITNAGGTPMAADHVFEFHFLRGDANQDRRVNLDDFNILASNFGQGGAGIDFTTGDFNYDGIVNLADFNLLAGRFGTVLSPAAPNSSSAQWTNDEDDAVIQLLR